MLDTYTDKLFALCFSKQISPNALCMLHMLKTSVYYKGLVNDNIEIESLLYKKYVEEVEGNIKLTTSGHRVLDEFEKLITGIRQSTKKTKYVLPENIEEMIKEFRELFPTGKQGSSPIRTNPEELQERFQWFFDTYPQYTWDMVIQATKNYLQTLENSSTGMQFISTAGHFIRKVKLGTKTGASLLADYCLMIQEKTEVRSDYVDMSKMTNIK